MPCFIIHVNLAEDLTPCIYLEKRKPLGTENLFGLLHAIKNRWTIRFNYFKFWNEELSERSVEPYLMREFKNRWYLLANDTNDAKIKTFSLDRLANLQITNRTFGYVDKFKIEKSHRYCFGIISADNDEPQEILLSFDPVQGRYIKSLPLHESQQILKEDNTEILMKLKLCVTHDLLMELLSFGENVKVIKPKRLVEQIKQAHADALRNYQ